MLGLSFTLHGTQYSPFQKIILPLDQSIIAHVQHILTYVANTYNYFLCLGYLMVFDDILKRSFVFHFYFMYHILLTL